MYLFLLKKALPFTLTFIFGALLSGLTGLFGASEKKLETVLTTRTYEYGRSCRMRSRQLVAESKPLIILFKPDARLPAGRESADESAGSARVSVTFGADGEVKAVKPLTSWAHGRDESLVRVKAMWDAVDAAARQIRFKPETEDGVPVTVEREVEIRFLPY
jgi:hypothetical protein